MNLGHVKNNKVGTGTFPSEDTPWLEGCIGVLPWIIIRYIPLRSKISSRLILMSSLLGLKKINATILRQVYYANSDIC